MTINAYQLNDVLLLKAFVDMNALLMLSAPLTTIALMIAHLTIVLPMNVSMMETVPTVLAPPAIYALFL